MKIGGSNEMNLSFRISKNQTPTAFRAVETKDFFAKLLTTEYTPFELSLHQHVVHSFEGFSSFWRLVCLSLIPSSSPRCVYWHTGIALLHLRSKFKQFVINIGIIRVECD